MIKLGIIGGIGAGKTFISKNFGYPTFNADLEVKKIYKSSKSCFKKLKKKFPNKINKYPIDKNEIGKLILINKKNIKILGGIVHPFVSKNLLRFLKKNKNKKAVVLDIPLLLENNIQDKKTLLIFIDAKEKEIMKRLKKRAGFNPELYKSMKKNQMPLLKKRKKCNIVIKNNFKKGFILKQIKKIKERLKSDRSSP